MQPCGAGRRSLGACSPALPPTPPLTQTAGKGTVQTHEGGGTEQSALKENASQLTR